MNRQADPMAILQRLLDRYERRSDGHRIIERPTLAFPTPSVRDSLVECLTSAARHGAVKLEFDRDAPHLIARVILQDAEKLYAFTGRKPRDVIARTASATLEKIPLQTPIAQMMRSHFAEAWNGARKLLALGPDNLSTANDLIVAAEAVFTDLDEDVPIRTRSARLLGDSKALERAMPSLLSYLKQVGVVNPVLSREEAMTCLGLVKYPQPVLVAGPLIVAGVEIGSWPYVGVPPDITTDVHLSRPIRTILTVENLESFNRHIRTCRATCDVVVYTGGFPSRSVLTLLRAVMNNTEQGLYHWGDIDPGGVRIGCNLEAALNVAIRPHLMTPSLAANFGKKPGRDGVALRTPKTSGFADLAHYLNQPNAHWLEQENIDPNPVSYS